MKSIRKIVVVAIFAIALPVFADDPGREFSAEAVVESRESTNTILVTFKADRFTSVDEAKALAGVLERGGQGALLATLRGRSDGELVLGALQMPVALVVAEPVGRGYRYLFLTPRQIRIDERQFGEESLNYPFGIAEFEVDDFGDGEGRLHVAAALTIDADGHVEIDDYDGVDGSLENLQQVR